ncbi:protoheme IX farnesyltransferase [Methylobacterium indicum]|uniref:Protoheme IX farnesyltransferase n=1 Tax=Methylobacterium indicum TaxID=1775910 RepID=A0A0J6RRB4_9HYPH|nr:heme o synthase [Methylobacterium indicum]KMO19157.1 protoheme IX farnesyltransferase [Methylobacterium indicum]KMO25420.1 protoheme IX farnesyltransferase [Methylobacterium indicum]KTS37962.1 protoheme IX farnesyltransferase [Methylobacterium indicum]KTS39825.1 protoheme IX farnesyltransferase [Methylobacterium indicum]KTS54600.1 protoheme IX farnesyltransferase [Methylobacterium indicum]
MTTLSNTAIPDRPFVEASTSGGEVADYFALLKPRVMALVIFTALVGMTVSPSHVNPVIGAISLLMIAVGAGASGCLNMWWDADVDAVMTRTRTRPIPAGRIQPGEALSFGLTLSVGSVLVLGLAANWLSAGLLAFTIVFYAVIYSMWLKRSTAQNIVIGGAAGALPPMIGQAVVTGSIGIEGTVLFLIIFIWTPPHFWALALVKAGEYARAGIPMMPNTAGPDSTRRQILAYSVLLAPLGLAPVFLGFGGLIYGLVGLVGGLAMVGLSVQVLRRREGEAANKAAMSLFGFSILYLFLLFSALLAEQGLGLFRPVLG